MDKNERQRLRRRRRKLRRIYLHVRRAVVILILLLICFGIFSGIKAIVHAITGSSPKTEQTAQKNNIIIYMKQTFGFSNKASVF